MSNCPPVKKFWNDVIKMKTLQSYDTGSTVRYRNVVAEHTMTIWTYVRTYRTTIRLTNMKQKFCFLNFFVI